MILPLLIIILLAGGVLALPFGRRFPAASRLLCIIALAADLAIVSAIWAAGAPSYPGASPWIAEYAAVWVPRFGIGAHLGLDGLSLLLIALTLIIGVAAVLASWSEVRERVGFFHFNIMAVLAGVVGVFLSLDLFLFYFFWEVMLVPMYFIIGIWGHEKRVFATLKFFIFTQASGLFMLVAIIGLAHFHAQETGVLTFEYADLAGTALPAAAAPWIMLGFFIAFAVKLPVLPLHTWLPDAHTEAPTAGSVVLASLLLKTGGYGFIRFILPLFPREAAWIAPVAMLLGVAGILYGALLAFAQTDLKRAVAYTSVSHMGFVLLGIFSMNELALRGAILEMLCHAFSTGALFILAGSLQERLRSREYSSMGGLLGSVPRMGAAGLIFALASMGLPGMGNFVAEFMILAGTYRTAPGFAVAGSLGLILSTAYALRIVQRVFFGQPGTATQIRDFTLRETAVMAVMTIIILLLGLYPQPVLDWTASFTRSSAAAAEAKTEGTAP